MRPEPWPWVMLPTSIATVSGARTVKQSEGAYRDPRTMLQEAMPGGTSITKHQQHPALLQV